jgi:hypothetical protein
MQTQLERSDHTVQTDQEHKDDELDPDRPAHSPSPSVERVGL